MSLQKDVPNVGQTVALWDNGKQVTVKVYKVTEDHVTVTMPDKKMWSMTLSDYKRKLTNEWG